MPADLVVQRDFYQELFGAQAAGAEGVFFVDELHGDYWAGGVEGCCFPDGGVGAAADGFAYQAEGEVGWKGGDLGLHLVEVVSLG